MFFMSAQVFPGLKVPEVVKDGCEEASLKVIQSSSLLFLCTLCRA